ncbi:MAG TPA: class I SAM-dependent methyltransferase [Myxococcaceae bacterium]|nr:class I SAM-dependent methyltransferase [Myxococcaceae bacterium]
MAGRRGIRVEDEERWVFNRLAADYAFRPGYPDELVARLAEIARAGHVADLGAGTGLLALPLARRGLEVTAVEPARGMLEVLQRSAGESVRCVQASAEDTGLPDRSCALVILADGLQWVDPELAGREAGRLIRPEGACAVVESKLGGTPFMDTLLEAIAGANPKAQSRSGGGALRQVLSLALERRPVWVEAMPQEVLLDEEALAPVVRSLSFVGPALGAPAVDRLVEEARRLAQAHGARWRRHLVLTWGRRA